MNVRANRPLGMVFVTITQKDEAEFYIGLLDKFIKSNPHDGGAVGDRNLLASASESVWPINADHPAAEESEG